MACTCKHPHTHNPEVSRPGASIATFVVRYREGVQGHDRGESIRVFPPRQRSPLLLTQGVLYVTPHDLVCTKTGTRRQSLAQNADHHLLREALRAYTF
jgi:hypothetical protein